MNRLLSDDSLNHNYKNDSTTLVTDDKPKGSTIVVCEKSGRTVTLPPIEIPKTRSLVKKEVCILTKINIKLHFVIYLKYFYFRILMLV